MIVTAVYYGRLRDALGLEREAFTLEETATVFTLRRLAFHRRPKAEHLKEALAFEVAHHLVALNQVLRPGDEVSFIPKDLKATGHGR